MWMVNVKNLIHSWLQQANSAKLLLLIWSALMKTNVIDVYFYAGIVGAFKDANHRTLDVAL